MNPLATHLLAPAVLKTPPPVARRDERLMAWRWIMTTPWLSWPLGASILFLAQQGTAATINPSDPQNKNVVISLDGLITEGDFPKFVTLIANQFGRSIAAIHLNSN